MGTAMVFCLLVSACSNNRGRSADDRILAQVYNKSLYLSDMDGMLPEGIAAEDSALIIDQYVKNWLRETAMLHEAEKNVPKGLDIDGLVADYRASLLKHNYEKVLVEKLLDSTVTQTELQDFYEKNKDQYKLETPIIRCRFIKAPRTAPRLDDVEKWWEGKSSRDQQMLGAWCAANATMHYLQDSTWYKVVDIAAYMPQGTLTIDNVAAKRSFTLRDDDFVYFFEVKNLVSRPEIAPLTYIESQARKVILHKRKTQLLEEMKDRLYEEAMRNSKVTVYE